MPLRGYMCLLKYWGWGLGATLLEWYMSVLHYWGWGLEARLFKEYMCLSTVLGAGALKLGC